jgi:polar amino acid transport system substrate-binding protein
MSADIQKSRGIMNTKRLIGRLIGAAVLLALGSTFAAAQDAATCADVQSKFPDLVGKKLVVGTTGDTPPYNYRSTENPDEIIGFNADYMRSVGECLAMPVEFFVADYAGLIPAVAAGQIDTAVSTLYVTDERLQQVDFVTYTKGSSGIVTLKANPLNLAKETDLCGRVAVATIGATQLRDLERISADCVAAGSPEIDITLSKGGPAGLRLLDSNRADFLLGQANPAAYDLDRYTIAISLNSSLRAGAVFVKGNPVAPAIYEALKVLQATEDETARYTEYGMSPDLMAPAEYVTE